MQTHIIKAKLANVQKFVDEVAQPRYKYGTLTIKPGKTLWKIVVDDSSVYCFVDGEGNVLKANSWHSAHPTIRGNIFSEQGGAEALDAQGFIRYLR